MIQGNCFELFNYLLEKQKKNISNPGNTGKFEFFGIFGGNHLKCPSIFPIDVIIVSYNSKWFCFIVPINNYLGTLVSVKMIDSDQCF